MSAPDREPDDNGPLQDGPLNYAPKRTQRPDQDPNLNGAPKRVDAALSRGMPESPEPPWKRKTQRGVFAGDVAVAQLRSQLALMPDRIPEPPLPASTAPVFADVGRLVGVTVVAAAGVIGYLWGSAPPANPPQLALASDQADLVPELSTPEHLAANLKASKPDSKPPAASGLAPARARSMANDAISVGAAQRPVPPATDPRNVSSPSAPRPPTLAPPASASPDSVPRAFAPQFNGKNSRDLASARAVPRQLTINAVRLRQADEPARLTISAADVGANVAVVIGGLAPGSALSAGTPAGPNGWRLSIEDFNNAAVTPPRGFLGVMDLTLELRLADNTVVDRKDLQLEWSGQSVLGTGKFPPRGDDAAEIAVKMKIGAELMANGDIAAARMMFQRAAEAGEAVAAFALAETYDPLVLRKLGAIGGITSDIALAQSWYEKARDLGSTVAPGRIVRLTRLPE